MLGCKSGRLVQVLEKERYGDLSMPYEMHDLKDCLVAEDDLLFFEHVCNTTDIPEGLRESTQLVLLGHATIWIHILFFDRFCIIH